MVGTKIKLSVEELKEQKMEFKVLHWISETDSIQIEAITFGKLLNENGEPLPDSKKIYLNALVHKDVKKLANNQDKYWQMERLGFFKFDEEGKLLRCVGL